MTFEPRDHDLDPETAEDVLPLAEAQSAPLVGKTAGGVPPIVSIGTLGLVAVVLFLVLNGRRADRAAQASPAPPSASATPWSSPPPLQMPAPAPAAPATVPLATAPAAPAPPAPAPAPLPAPSDSPDSSTRLHAPAVVLDLGGSAGQTVVAQGAPAPGAAQNTGAGAQRPQLSDSEQFARRVGAEEPDRAYATPMHNPRTIAPQGTIIPGVLETAINSDLPGYARAIVSRDVLSFDGKAVLIPRSSRLIGQYKSALALGQTRVFVIWTRIIRPDGASILIASPGADELGRAGLDGKVNRHFLRRFSGSILLSVLNAGVAAVGRTPSTQISIGSPNAASGLASAAVLGDDIPPTIRVAQGDAINIFVARDLDFSGVEAVK